jgi:hypothetical protein
LGEVSVRAFKGLERLELLERFWEKVAVGSDPLSECWEWTDALLANGYGRLTVWTGTSHEPIFAHRLSYLLNRGDIPPGMLVCHTCDNRRCVRPSHLFLGTQKDNMADAALKGRMRGGIPSKTAEHAWAFYRLGRKPREIAFLLGVPRTYVYGVVARKKKGVAKTIDTTYNQYT